MIKLRRAALVLSCAVVLVPAAKAQYAFDVKTQVEDKHGLQVVKESLLHAIAESSWASVTEVGEDYSLWLDNLSRVHRGDTVYAAVDVYLRTPAMFTSGRPVGARRAWISYHWDEVTSFSRDSIDAAAFSASNRDYGLVAQEASRLLGFALTVSGFSFTGSDVLVAEASAPLLSALVVGLASALQRDPSPVEVMESVLLGQQCLAATRDIIERGY